jgi:PAS domain S-box-containing protein
MSDKKNPATGKAHVRQSDSAVNYATIFNAASNGMAFTDFTTGKILDVNYAWIKATGIDRAKCIGISAFELGIWASQADRKACMEELQKNGRVVDYEAILIMKSVETPHLISGQFAEMNGRQCVLWEFRDITEQKRINEKLRESEVFRKQIFYSSRAPIIVMDAEKYIYLDCNEAAARIYGFSSRENVIGKNPMDFSAPVQYDGTPSLDKALSYIEKAESDGGVVFEWLHQRPDGEKWDAEVHLMSFQSGPRHLLQFTLQDITGRKQIEHQIQTKSMELAAQNEEYEAINEELTATNRDLTISEEKLNKSLREKETLIRELYHRTKNTLNVIRGMIVIQAAEYPENSDIQHLVKTTEDRIQVISLVHQMLYQGRDLSQICIKDYIENLSRLIFESFCISMDRISLNYKIDSRHFLLDTAIPLGLILNELMTNSLKHAFPDNRKGTISITLSCDEYGKTVFRYSDNGTGVSDGFDFRNTKSLGMKLIHSIAEQQMLGTLAMKNDNGVTCTFEFLNNLYKARV